MLKLPGSLSQGLSGHFDFNARYKHCADVHFKIDSSVRVQLTKAVAVLLTNTTKTEQHDAVVSASGLWS